MSNTTIFYGAGDSAKFNYERFVDAGLIPDCFADKDKSKHQTKFDPLEYTSLQWDTSYAGGQPILPLDEAISRHPNYIIYPTQNPQVRPKIIEYLVEHGVERNRIRTFEEQGFEWRLGCKSLSSAIVFWPDKIMACCSSEVGGPNTFYSGTDISEPLKDHYGLRKQITDDLLSGRQTVCTGCPNLKDGFYRTNSNYELVALDGVFKHSKCNLMCIYCGYTKKSDFDKNNTSISVLEALRQILVMCPDVKIIRFVPGEPTINPEFEEAIRLCEQNNLSVEVLTNCVVYSEKLAEMMKKGKGQINVSLDSGTRVTYKKIKQVDCFDNVINNLYKYAEAGGKIELKYILLQDTNDNYNEIGAFIDIAASINAKIIIAQNDVFAKKRLSKNYSDLLKQFISNSLKRNVFVRIETSRFDPIDFKSLDEFRKHLLIG